MIAVAANHRSDVALRPILEIKVIILRILGFAQQSNDSSMTRIPSRSHASKRGRRRVVAGANGVEAICLHQFHAAFFRAINRRRAERAVVVVHATALEFEHLTVEPETVLGVHLDFANAEMIGSLVQRFASRNLHFRRIQLRRISDHSFGDLTSTDCSTERVSHGSQTQFAFGGLNRFAFGIQHAGAHHHVSVSAGAVANFSRDLHDRVVFGNFRRRDEDAPCRHVNRFGNGQPSVPIDARAGIPAAVLALVADADGNDVYLTSRFQVRRQVEFKTRVAVRMIAEVLAVDPKSAFI